MSFSNPFGTKTDDVSTVTAAELNAAGASIASAFDVNGTNTVIGTHTFTGATLNGTITLGAAVTHSGSASTTQWRLDNTTLGDADATIDISKDIWITATATSSTRTWTLRHSTSPVPSAGHMIHIVRSNGGGPSAVNVKREGGTTVVTLGAGLFCTATVYFDGTNWRLLQTVNGTPGAGA